jgi:hypothetical protein
MCLRADSGVISGPGVSFFEGEDDPAQPVPFLGPKESSARAGFPRLGGLGSLVLV